MLKMPTLPTTSAHPDSTLSGDTAATKATGEPTRTQDYGMPPQHVLDRIEECLKSDYVREMLAQADVELAARLNRGTKRRAPHSHFQTPYAEVRFFRGGQSTDSSPVDIHLTTDFNGAVNFQELLLSLANDNVQQPNVSDPIVQSRPASEIGDAGHLAV